MLFSPLLTPYAFLLIPFLYYLLPYLRSRALRDIPGPFPAAFTNLWLLYQCRRGRRYLAVDNAHKRHGPLVRIQPDHVSVADTSAIQVIYSHGGGWMKRYVLLNKTVGGHGHRCPYVDVSADILAFQ